MFAYRPSWDAPLSRRFGLRGEYISKHQQLSEDDIGLAGSGTLQSLETPRWIRWGPTARPGYGWWGTATAAAAGEELPVRLASVVDGVAADGLMLAARFEFLKEDLRSDNPGSPTPTPPTTRVLSGALGANYWYSKRFRFSATTC